MSDDNATPQRARRRSQANGNSACHSCQRCRQKKIKCGGERPRCWTCRTKSLACEYAQDARRSAIRTQRPDVVALQKQIQSLQQQLGSPPGGGGAASLTPDSPVRRPSTARRSNTASPVAINANAAVHHAAPNTALPTIQGQKIYGFNVASPHTVTLQLGSDAQNDHDDTLLSDDEAEAESELTVAVARGQVYGPTSILRPQSSKTNSPASTLVSQTKERHSTEATRDKLVANALFIRQQETAFYSSPSIVSNIDFDGVPADMAMHLLNLHWNRQHLSYLVTYRPAIMDSLINGGPYVNKLLLNAIFFSTSLYSDRPNFRSDPRDPQTLGLVFYERVKELLGQQIDKPAIPTVVGLILCGSSLVQYGKQSAGWTLCGMAYRMLHDLGCHLDISSTSQKEDQASLSPLDIEIRKRVYWGAFICDKFQSLYLGRAPALRRCDATVSDDLLDTYEELEEWKPYIDPLAQSEQIPSYQGRPSRAISTFQSLLRLCTIAGKVIDELFSIKSTVSPIETLLQNRLEARADLLEWKNGLPTHLQLDLTLDSTPPPHQITPHTTYWALTILVEQAFLDQEHLKYSLDASSQTESKNRCIEAALNIWKLARSYKETFTLRRAQYGISYAMYCAALVILQHTDPTCEEHIQSLWFFWSALSENEKGLSFGLKKPMRILKSLMRRLKGLAQPHEHGQNLSERDDTNRQLIHNVSVTGMTDHIITSPTSGFNHITDLQTTWANNMDAWSDSSWLGSFPDDSFVPNDLLFGILMPETALMKA